MFLDSSTTRLNGKAYPRHLLRESYREAGKVKHRTIANLSHCKAEEVEGSNSKSRNLLDVHGLSPAFMRSGGIEKVARDWRKTSQEGKIT